jgi:very-short-patch-repair endonuclease
MTIRDALESMRVQPRAFSTREILDVSSWAGLDGALKRGEIVRVLPGLYSADVHAESWSVRASAVARWMRGCTLTGPSALRLYGLEAVRSDTLEVVTPRPEHRMLPPWLRVRRSDIDVPCMELAGHRAHLPPFALVVGNGLVAPSERAELVYAVVREAVVRPADAIAAMRELPRVVGRANLIRRLTLAAEGVESFLEEQAWATVLRGTLASRLVRQHTVRVRGNGYRLDAYDPATRTAVEFDGARWHRGLAGVRDSRRDALLATIGILTVRFAYTDVMDRPMWCRGVLREVLAARAEEASEEVSYH